IHHKILPVPLTLLPVLTGASSLFMWRRLDEAGVCCVKSNSPPTFTFLEISARMPRFGNGRHGRAGGREPPETQGAHAPRSPIPRNGGVYAADFNPNVEPLQRPPWRRHGPGLDRRPEGENRPDARGMASVHPGSWAADRKRAPRMVETRT